MVLSICAFLTFVQRLPSLGTDYKMQRGSITKTITRMAYNGACINEDRTQPDRAFLFPGQTRQIFFSQATTLFLFPYTFHSVIITQAVLVIVPMLYSWTDIKDNLFNKRLHSSHLDGDRHMVRFCRNMLWDQEVGGCSWQRW